MEWKDNILTADDDIRKLLSSTKSIAVIGIKPGSHSIQPAHYVPKFMASVGYEIIPVPVYYPEITEILGKPVVRTLGEIDGAVDMVNVFRRSDDIAKHVDEILAKRPKSVWIQLGLRNDAAAEQFARAGIKVVQDMCLMVEYRALISRAGY